MNINFTFKNFEPSEHLKKYAQRRFEKISKYVGGKDDNSELNVNLSVDKYRHRAEVIFTGDKLHLSANETSEDMYSSIDLVLDKLEAQVRKNREKSKDKRKGSKGRVKPVQTQFFQYSESEDGTRERKIVDSDNFEPKPMGIDEAAMQLDNLNCEFLVFQNSETDRVNVIYRRKNDDFGLIDPGT